jgi:hypothetical protein
VSTALVDRSSRPYRCPHRTRPGIEAQIAELRGELKLGPARIGYRLGVARPPCTGSLSAWVSIGWRGWTAQPAGSSVAMSVSVLEN